LRELDFYLEVDHDLCNHEWIYGGLVSMNLIVNSAFADNVWSLWNKSWRCGWRMVFLAKSNSHDH